MIQNTPLTNIPSAASTQPPVAIPPVEVIQGRPATVWAGRIARVVGAMCLLAALLEWATRPGHLRPVLALLIIAMFAAILHSYTFEGGN